MAKDLPYFKFFCSEWNDGDITLEDYRIQGLFINICSYYWSNNCDVSIKKLKKKFKDESKSIDYLIKERLIKIDSNNVVISFLIEQLGERDSLSSQNSVNAKKRWDAIRKEKEISKNINATALNTHCDNNAESMQYREEEKREEEKREDNKNQKVFNFRKSLIDYGFKKELVEDWLKVRRTKKATNTETAFNGFISQVVKSNIELNKILIICIEKSWSGFNYEWVKEEVYKNSLTSQNTLENKFKHLNLKDD
jgi:hypothetical protein